MTRTQLTPNATVDPDRPRQRVQPFPYSIMYRHKAFFTAENRLILSAFPRIDGCGEQCDAEQSRDVLGQPRRARTICIQTGADMTKTRIHHRLLFELIMNTHVAGTLGAINQTLTKHLIVLWTLIVGGTFSQGPRLST